MMCQTSSGAWRTVSIQLFTNRDSQALRRPCPRRREPRSLQPGILTMFVARGLRTLARIGAVLAMLTVVGCGGTDIVLVDGVAVVVLTGAAMTEGGAPVPGAQVTIIVEDPAIPGWSYGPAAFATTDAAGAFAGRIELQNFAEFLARVTVIVTPSAGSGLGPGSITIPSLRFRTDGMPDTAQVTITLPAGSS